MSPQQKINSTQLQLLQLIGAQGGTNLLKARMKLSWDLEKFAVSLNSLETAGLINREGFKASCTAEGLVTLGMHARDKLINKTVGDVGSSYVNEVIAPRLSVNEPWLPNLESFLHAMGIRK